MNLTSLNCQFGSTAEIKSPSSLIVHTVTHTGTKTAASVWRPTSWSSLSLNNHFNSQLSVLAPGSSLLEKNSIDQHQQVQHVVFWCWSELFFQQCCLFCTNSVCGVFFKTTQNQLNFLLSYFSVGLSRVHTEEWGSAPVSVFFNTTSVWGSDVLESYREFVIQPPESRRPNQNPVQQWLHVIQRFTSADLICHRGCDVSWRGSRTWCWGEVFLDPSWCWSGSWLLFSFFLTDIKPPAGLNLKFL